MFTAAGEFFLPLEEPAVPEDDAVEFGRKRVEVVECELGAGAAEEEGGGPWIPDKMKSVVNSRIGM